MSRHRNPVRSAGSAALILMSAAAVTACAECEELPEINYYRAEAQVVTVLDATAEGVGGEWGIERVEGAGWCQFDGGDGKKFAATRSAVPSGNPEDVAEKVRADWESRGLSVGTYADSDLHAVNASGPEGLYVHFATTAALMTLTGESACTRAD